MEIKAKGSWRHEPGRSASSTCHGTSNIKIFDTKNRYVGEYYVGMPEGLHDIIRGNKLIYLENSEDCNLRKTRSINLENGLPRNFYIPCSKSGGDQYSPALVGFPFNYSHPLQNHNDRRCWFAAKEVAERTNNL